MSGVSDAPGPSPVSPGEAPVPAQDHVPRWTPDPNSFALYFVKYLLAVEHYRMGTVPEAEALQAGCDLVLTRTDGMSLQMLCIVDRQTNPLRQFAVPNDEIDSIGAACLKYCGKINRSQMPVVIHIIEIGRLPASQDEKDRLAAYRPFSAFSKVRTYAWVLDPGSGSVWANSRIGRLYGRKYQRLLREPRRSDAELQARGAPAVLPVGRPLVTFGLLILLSAVFLGEHLFSADGETSGVFGLSVRTLGALGGLNKSLVLEQGEWYRLLSAIFLHGDLLHLLMNGVALYFAGRILETLVGRWWFLALFFVGGIGGSLLSLAVNPPDMISVGASGAIMALLSAAFVCSFRWPWGAQRRQAQMNLLPILVPSLLPFLSFGPGHPVDFAAHLGGATSGVIVGWALFRTWPLDQALPRFRYLAAGLAIVGLCSSILVLWPIVRQHQAWTMAGRLIPKDQMPKTDAEAKAHSAELVDHFPGDPRAHFAHALALLDAADEKGAEAELKAALAANASLPGMFSNDLGFRLQAVLALVLLQNSKADEARDAAASVCASQMTAYRAELERAGLCR